MTRTDLLRILILNDVADDYENLEHVTAEVARVAAINRLRIDREEVCIELSNLIAYGLIGAYRLSASSINEVAAVTAAASLGDYYYWQTPKGRAAHQNVEWPFDDEGRLLSGIEDT
jgi:hypothetical protein